MLIVSRKPGASLLIGDNIRIEILGIVGTQVKLGIHAPREISVLRSEVLDTIRTNASATGQIPEQMLDLFLDIKKKSLLKLRAFAADKVPCAK